MNFSDLELNHEANNLAQFESNLIDAGYIIHCDIKNVELDSLNRPFEQTATGRVMLSNIKLVANRH